MTEEKNNFEEEITEIIIQLGETLTNKNKQYGNSFYEGLNDIKELFQNSDDKIMKKTHYFSFYVRAKDKLNRIKNLIPSKIPEKDKKDAIYDAVLDLAGYTILFLNYIKNYDK